MAKEFHLLVAVPDKEPVSYVISGEKISLGRSPDNDIQILVREVSTTHCEFHLTESGYEVTDVGSTNGTKVNDQSVKNGKMALSDRDIVLLGETIPAYFVAAEEGEAIDVKSLISKIQATADVAVEKLKPAVKKLVPPSAVKKIGLSIKKPPVSAPLKPTMAQGSEVGSSTVKLAPPVAKKLSPPSLAKKAAPGAPPAASAKPTSATPPVTKLAPPRSRATPPATKLATSGAPAPPPATKLATPGGVGGPAKKLSIQREGEPSKKLAVPNQNPEGNPPKLDLPQKKTVPKLNLPPKNED